MVLLLWGTFALFSISALVQNSNCLCSNHADQYKKWRLLLSEACATSGTTALSGRTGHIPVASHKFPSTGFENCAPFRFTVMHKAQVGACSIRNRNRCPGWHRHWCRWPKAKRFSTKSEGSRNEQGNSPFIGINGAFRRSLLLLRNTGNELPVPPATRAPFEIETDAAFWLFPGTPTSNYRHDNCCARVRYRNALRLTKSGYTEMLDR
jgi:hypothetical protein